VAEASALQPIPVDDAVQAQVLDFIAGRLSVLLKETYRYDVVDAALAAQSENPAGAARTAEQLQSWVTREDWGDIFPAYARCVRILRAAKYEPDEDAVNESLLAEASERALFEAIRREKTTTPADLDEALHIVERLTPSINRFFDDVLVMAEEKAIRENRLALVSEIAALPRPFADLSKLEGF
jgi:glycyl-tRNA synthetase